MRRSAAVGRRPRAGVYALFTSEMLIKMVAMGLACHRGAYLSDNWNRLDFIVVLLGWLPTSYLPSATCQRSVRCAPCARCGVFVLPGVKRQATTLLDSMLKMADVLVLFGFSRAVWSARRSALQGHAPLPVLRRERAARRAADRRGRGRLPSPEGGWRGRLESCGPEQECRFFGTNPVAGTISFDHIGSAPMTIFQCVTLRAGWM